MGFLNVVLVISSLFLICLVLIQRGKGGGLAGAFGGAGGASAFGTKAGDIFTKITMYTAVIWIVLNMLSVYLSNQGSVSAYTAAGGKTSTRVPISSTKTGTGTGATPPAPLTPEKPLPSTLPPASTEKPKSDL